MGKIKFNWFTKPDEVLSTMQKDVEFGELIEKPKLTKSDIEAQKRVFVEDFGLKLKCSSKSRSKTPSKCSAFLDFMSHLMVAILTIAALLACMNFIVDVSQGKVLGYRHVYYVCVSLTAIITILYYVFEYETQEKRVSKILKQVTPKFAFIFQSSKSADTSDGIALRIRVASKKTEYIEIDFDKEKSGFTDLVNICCNELNIEKDNLVKLIKYPETRIRNDADIKRLRKVEYIDIVIKPKPPKSAEVKTEDGMK